MKEQYANGDFIITKRAGSMLGRNKHSLHCYRDAFRISYSLNNDPLEQRLLIGHELGNIVCHWEPGRDGIFVETDDERREAAFFAKLLLEDRAANYIGNRHSEDYKEACKMILNAVKNVYSGQTWLDWVLEY